MFLVDRRIESAKVNETPPWEPRLIHLSVFFMAIVVNNPAERSVESSSMGTLFVVVGVLIALTLFFVYGLPVLRRGVAPAQDSANINVQIPTPNINPNPNPSPAPAPGQ